MIAAPANRNATRVERRWNAWPLSAEQEAGRAVVYAVGVDDAAGRANGELHHLTRDYRVASRAGQDHAASLAGIRATGS